MSDTATSLPAPRPAMALLVTLRRNKLSWIGIALLAAIVLMAVFAPLLAPVAPIKQNIIHRLEPPPAEFLLGTASSARSEERRGGKACGSTGRSASPPHPKKQ